MVLFPKMVNSSTSFGVKYNGSGFGHSEFEETVKHPGEYVGDGERREYRFRKLRPGISTSRSHSTLNASDNDSQLRCQATGGQSTPTNIKASSLFIVKEDG